MTGDILVTCCADKLVIDDVVAEVKSLHETDGETAKDDGACLYSRSWSRGRLITALVRK